MQKASTKQLSILVILGVSLTKFNILPAFISKISGEGLWLSCTLNFILDFLILLCVIKIVLNYKGLSFYEILEVNFGKVFSKIIAFLYSIFFILKGLILIVEQKNSIELTFYETQPTFITFMPFFIIAFFILIKGNTAFLRGIEICFFLGALGLIAIILLSVGAGNYSYLLPLFKKPYAVIYGAFNGLIWFGDPIYILLFGGRIDASKNFKKSLIISYFIAFLTTIFILVVFYAVFESIAPRQYYATLKMSKYSISLSNIGRFDYISAFLLALVNVYLVSMPLLFCSNLLKEVLSLKSPVISSSITVIVVFVFSLLLQHDFLRFLEFAQRYLVWFFIPLTYIFPLILTLKIKRRKANV